mmetsp:Transcript_7355/g.16856  ORF Transcript_7355/g.16856 Transcript_7355/m.16856 type:complete len:96 (-) Transcript_7355:147-434(-)
MAAAIPTGGFDRRLDELQDHAELLVTLGAMRAKRGAQACSDEARNTPGEFPPKSLDEEGEAPPAPLLFCTEEATEKAMPPPVEQVAGGSDPYGLD